MRFALGLALALSLEGATDAGKLDFQRDIRPILSDKCFQCHGPDEAKRMAGLRLDQPAAAPVVVPGDSAGSKLWQRVSHEKKAMRMPPPTSGITLTNAESALIKRWIDSGAEYKIHWAFQLPTAVEPPQNSHPRWNANPIDRFLYARLMKEGLAPSRRASKETLIRRLSFDLTGLPPTPAEVDSFVRDKSTGAYARLVDRLLASPHYGERMAMPWLDLARYADTHGYHIDSHRDMWPWRDWVISAFNRNISFKDFIEWQVAGDLFDSPTTEMQVATGFSRNHMINFEGGAIPEEYLVEYVRDRTDTVGTVFLGLTVGCAKCHDHKYDPISQRDYYRLAAFFNTVPEKGLDGQKGNAAPFLPLPDAAQQQRLAELKVAMQDATARLPEEDVAVSQFLWERSRFDQQAVSPTAGLTAWYELDGSFSDLSGNFRHGQLIKGEPGFGDGAAGRGLNLDASVQFRFPKGALLPSAPFTLAFWIRFGRNPGMSVLQEFESARRGFEVALGESKVLPQYRRGQKLDIRWIDDGRFVHLQTRDWLLQGRAHHIGIVSGGTAESVRLFVNGEPEELVVLKPGSLPEVSAPLEVGNSQWGASTFRGFLDDIRAYARPLDQAELVQLAIHYPAAAAIRSPAKRSRERAAAVRDYYLTYAAPDDMRAAYQDVKRLLKQKEGLDAEIVTTMVMKEMEKPRDTFFLVRGEYSNPGDKVAPAVPSFLPPLPAGEPANRLALARWLTGAANPLTARVAVNRFWQMYFGHGIVKTSEDFGSQGEPPVNKELLDWLAVEFMRTGWDVKSLQRLIVTSEAYKQDSRSTPALNEKDPENRLLARGPRIRLPGEMIRDSALAAGGLLVDAVGGPSVLPYQPPGIWEELAFGEEFTAQEYHQDHGDKLWRRTMYTFWKRTAPPASMSTFDAPDREKCVARRSVTNTPLQALVTLNDPTFVEAARALAQRVWREAPKSDDERIRQAFRLVTARQPSSRELAILRGSLSTFSRTYNKEPALAGKLLSVGESRVESSIPAPALAAWTNLCSIILNTDEAITKE